MTAPSTPALKTTLSSGEWPPPPLLAVAPATTALIRPARSYDVESGAKSFLLPKWRRTVNGDTQSHSGEVLCVAASSDGKYIASGGRDKLVRIFDRRTNAEVKALSGHRDAVTCVSFQRDSSSLFTGSLDRCIKHWDMAEMGYLETLFGHQVSGEGEGGWDVRILMGCGVVRRTE